MMIKFITSCEHGGNEIPTDFQRYFTPHQEILKTHRGWDPGALNCARIIAKRMNTPLHYCEISRLLIECNRTLQHSQLFSSISKDFSDQDRETLIHDYYLPYRNKLQEEIKKSIDQGYQVIHLSIHSFTPVLNLEVRKAEIGILFDPDKLKESAFALKWQKRISKKEESWRVKLNYPYLGTDDGLTAYFRSVFPANYTGLELEINQKLFDIYPSQHISEIVIPNFKFETELG